MFGTIIKATNSSFKKGMTSCRSIYVTKVMKLLAFIFEQPSYKWISTGKNRGGGTNLRIRENKWIRTGINRGGGLT